MAEAYLLVRCGDRRVGLPVSQLEAVAEAGPVMPVPASEPALAGVCMVRGETTPVVNLAALLGRAVVGRGEVLIVVRLDGVRLCVEVDEADVVVQAESLPLPEETAAEWARGVIRMDDAFVPILDLGALGARLFETGRA